MNTIWLQVLGRDDERTYGGDRQDSSLKFVGKPPQDGEPLLHIPGRTRTNVWQGQKVARTRIGLNAAPVKEQKKFKPAQVNRINMT